MSVKIRLVSVLVLLLPSASVKASGLYEVPASVKAKYAPLYSLKVVEQADGSFSFGQARRFNRRGINVLYLVGDRFEMAFQHGRLLQNEIRQGALLDAAAGLGHSVMEVMGENLVSKVAASLLYRTITDRMYKFSLSNPVSAQVDPRADGYGLSEGSGIDLKTLVRAALSTESITVLLGKNLNGKLFSKNGSSPNQCSSFVAWGDATANGEVIIGRNTDYWLNGSFDRFPTVIYFNPTDGFQKFMTVSSAGIHNAGVVGMNESGIYVDVHTVPTKDVSSDGIPVFMIAQEVLRSARTFDQALANFQKAKPGAGWTYVLVSTRERKATTIELSNTGIGIRPMTGDTLVQTNHYLTKEMQSRFEPVNASTVVDTHSRYKRMTQMLAEGRGALDERTAAAIMGDKWDVSTNQPAWLGNTVAVHSTMTSAVVQPDRGRIFVANGTAPVSQTEFVEFPILLQDPGTFSSAPYDHFANDSFKIQHPDMAAAEQAFIRAKIAYERDLNLEKTAEHLEAARQLDPTAAGVPFLLGIVKLRLKQYGEAEALFKALIEGFTGHHQQLARYYLARLYESQGRKAEAAAPLAELVQAADPITEKNLIEAAAATGARLRKMGKKGFGLMDLPIMFQQADLITYR